MIRPAHCTALGKGILASLSEDQLSRFLNRVELKPSTDKSITDIPTLLREIAEVRRSGAARDQGEFNLGVRCIAVAVREFTGQIAGALRHLWTDLATDRSRQQAKTRALQAAANCLPATFGARGATVLSSAA